MDQISSRINKNFSRSIEEARKSEVTKTPIERLNIINGIRGMLGVSDITKPQRSQRLPTDSTYDQTVSGTIVHCDIKTSLFKKE